MEQDDKKERGTRVPLLAALSCLSEGRNAAPAAAKLLSELATSQNTTEGQNELKYVINRLVKGTASNRQNAREGFFSALVVLLKANEQITFKEIFDVLNKELQISGQSKSEMGEVCTGHVLVSGAILRSECYIRSTEEEKAQLINTMFNASDKKAYLGIAAYYFVVDFIKTHSEEVIKAHLWPYLESKLSKPIVDHNLDSIYCLLILNEHCPALIKKFLKKTVGFKSLFSDEAVPQISEKLMNVPEFSYINHPIYEAFGREVVKSDNMVSCWCDGLEKKLNVNNENRVLIVLTVFAEILQNIDSKPQEIPPLLGDKFIPCILEWFKGFQTNQSGKSSSKNFKSKGNMRQTPYESKGRQIMVKSKEVFEILLIALKKGSVTPKIRLEVLNKLLFTPGDIMFCDITNSKIIKLLIEELDTECVHSFAEVLKKVVSNESKKTHPNGSERFWTNSERLRAAEMLTYLINHKTTSGEMKWRIKNMQFLVMISLFKTTGGNDAYVSGELAVAVKKCFYRCLSFKLPKLETLLKILSSLVEYIDTFVSKPENLNNNKTFNPTVVECWNSMKSLTSTLESSEESETSKAIMVFQILALHCGLFLFSDVMNVDTVKSSLQEINSCYEHYKKPKKSKAKKSIDNGDVVEDEPEWTEVLIDIFLSFLSRDSYLLRNVVQCVFRLLCDYLTPSAIGQILSVLDPDDDTNILSYKDNAMNEEDDRESDISQDENEGEDKSESSESSESEDNNEEEEDDITTVNDQLRMAVQKALGNAGAETDTESVDIDNIDEEEGHKIDNALSGAFRLLKQSKGEMSKKEKKNTKTLMEFRIRVLDLVNIYLEKVPTMDICLGMLSPLFTCLEFAIKDSVQKPLEDRVRKSLKCLTGVKIFTSIDDVTPEVLSDYLTSIISRGARTQFMYQALGDVISKCGTFIVRCSQKLQIAETSSKKKRKSSVPLPIANIYNDSLEAFFTKRDCLLPVIFFHDVLQIKWDGNWTLLNTIIEKTFDNNVRQFRRNEGLEMINLFYTSIRRNMNNDTVSDIANNLQLIEKQLSDKIITVFNEPLKENSISLTERFFTILLKTLNMIKNYHNSAKQYVGKIDWKEIADSIQSHRKSIKLRNTQEYFKFCNLFGLEKLKNCVIENVKTKERESIDSGHESNADDENVEKEAVEVKVKVSKKKQKLLNGNSEENESTVNNKLKYKKNKDVSKKESKRLRLLASSDGLQHISFATLLQDSNMDINQISEEPEIDDVKKDRKKKKADTALEVEKPKKIKIIP